MHHLIVVFVVMRVGSTDLLLSCVGGSLISHILAFVCYDYGCYLLWCLYYFDVCAIDVISCLDKCEVYRPAPGVRRWVSHASSHCCFCCDACGVYRPAPVCRWVSHFSHLSFCVFWLWLLSTMMINTTSLCVLDKCEVYRPAPGVRRWVSHASSHCCFCCDACGVYRPAPELCRWVSHFSHLSFCVLWLWLLSSMMINTISMCVQLM